MIWDYWSTGELQKFITQKDNKLLDRLQTIIPALEGGDYDPTQLMLRKNLVKIVSAFAPSDIFRKKDFMKWCLDRLPPEQLESLANRVGLGIDAVSFDERRNVIVSKSWNDIEYAKAFLEFFGLPDHFLAPRNQPVPQIEYHEPPSRENPRIITSSFKTLKDYQFPVFVKSLDKLKIPRSRFVVQMPTGAGKTRTAMEMITTHINSSKNSELPPLIIWLAHSEELCEQAFQCFNEVWSHVASMPLQSIRAWGGYTIPTELEIASFIVGSFQGLHADLVKNPSKYADFKTRTRLIIVDEAHKSVAPTYKAVIESLLGLNCNVVGLTATPGRSVVEETEELADFYFEDIVGVDDPDNRGVVPILKEKKVLSRVVYQELITNIDYHLTETQIKKLDKEFDFSKEFLGVLSGDDIRNLEIMKRLLNECKDNRKILFFGCSVDHSQFITAILIYFGVPAAHIDGSTDKRRRAAIIDSFRSGNLQVLCNYGVLSTGFDAPNTDTIFISRPTNSAVLYSQMIGRGLRGPAIGGTPSCKVIDVRDNIIGYGDADRVYDYFEEYWG